MPSIQARPGVELHYEITGPAGMPVAVFSNSIGTTLEMWDRQVSALSDRYRCLRYDTRGHGRSPVVGKAIRIEDLADDLAGLLDALAIEQAHIVGLSLGGMTAQSFGVRHAGRARSLTFMATSAYLPTGWDERAALVREKGMHAIVDAVLPRWFTLPFLETPNAEVTALRGRFLSNDPEGYALCCEAIRDMDLRENDTRLTQPTLIVAGADDPATPVAMMEDIRARVSGAEFVVIPQAAHILTIEQGDAINGVLGPFLDRSGR